MERHQEFLLTLWETDTMGGDLRAEVADHIREWNAKAETPEPAEPAFAMEPETLLPPPMIEILPGVLDKAIQPAADLASPRRAPEMSPEPSPTPAPTPIAVGISSERNPERRDRRGDSTHIPRPMEQRSF